MENARRNKQKYVPQTGALLLLVSCRENKSPYMINAALYIPTQRLRTKPRERLQGEYKSASARQQGRSKMMRETLGCAEDSFRSQRGRARAARQKERGSGLLFFAAVALRAGAATAPVVTAQNLQVSEILNSAKDGAQKHLTCDRNSTVCWKKVCVYIYCCAQCSFHGC